MIGDTKVEGGDDASEGLLAAMLSSSFAASLMLDTNGATTTTLHNSTWNTLAHEDWKALLLQWGKWHGSSKREETEESMILAEMVYTKLELASEVTAIVNTEMENHYKEYHLLRCILITLITFQVIDIQDF